MKKQLEIKLTTKFKKQLKAIRKQPNFNYNELDNCIIIIKNVPSRVCKLRKISKFGQKCNYGDHSN